MPQADTTSIKIFTEVLPHPCTTAEDLVAGARELLHSSEAADGGNVLLAKASHGHRTLVLMADRDNYEFSLRTAERRSHVAGGVFASDLRTISLAKLKQMMAMYLERETPIVIPDWRAVEQKQQRIRQHLSSRTTSN